MIQALDMELETVRSVVANDACEVSVCRDRLSDSGTFYTDVAIRNPELRRDLAHRLAAGELFDGNADFLGSFTLRDELHLVFHYHRENRLSGHEEEYCTTFAARKQLSVSFLAACAQIGAQDGVGELVTEDTNVNVSETGGIYFNYFLDFSRLRPSDELDFLRSVSMRVYDILSSGYRMQFDGDVERYPDQLQLFYRKAQARGFTSLSQLLAFVRDLPDEPEEHYVGVRRLLYRVRQIREFARSHSTEFFLGLLVFITLVYAVTQIVQRVLAGQERQEVSVYAGIDQIGEVWLGDEDI